MKQKIRLVVAAGIERVVMEVHSVRQPRQRMPVRSMESSEGPSHRRPIQLLNGNVVDDVSAIIKINERVFSCRRVHRQSYYDENNSRNNASPTRRRKLIQASIRLDVRHGLPMHAPSLFR